MSIVSQFVDWPLLDGRVTAETYSDGPIPDPRSLALEELKLLIKQLVSR
jgi:hypothetical protein